MPLPVVIPAFNRPELLSQTLQSAFQNAASQIFPIVIDDHSSQEVKAVCQPYIDANQIRYHRMHRQTGPGVCRTYGAALDPTNHPYIYFSDSDIYFQKNWDQIMLNTLKRHPNIGILSGAHFPALKITSTLTIPHGKLILLEETGGFSMLMSKKNWLRFGPFKATKVNIPSEDRDLCQTFTQNGLNIAALDPSVVIHTGLTSSFWQHQPPKHMLKDRLKYPHVLFQ